MRISEGLNKLKVIWSSDWHLGLKTEEIDRTDEILSVGLDIVSYAVAQKDKGHEVIIVLGGDIFDTNTPSEKHIAVLLKILNPIKVNNIKTFIMVGNHDAIAEPTRLSCLSFIREAKIGYPSITLIDDIKFIKVGVFDNGPLYFTFLPHITKATFSGKSNEFRNSQEYIDTRCEKIVERMGKGSQHIVFSHLNVSGAHPGSEENLLKRSEVFLPKCFLSGGDLPIIIQGHIHSPSIIGNIHIIGSPIYCTFGESEKEKYFAEIDVSKDLSKETDVHLIQTKYKPFLSIELDLINETRDFFDLEDVNSFLLEIKSKVHNLREPIVKFDVIIDAEHNSYDWYEIRRNVMRKFDCFVKAISPRVIVSRSIRAVDQKINLTPKEAVKVYIKRNLKKDAKKAKLVWGFSKKYLGE